MDIGKVSGGTANTGGKIAGASSELDREAFLKILVAQLKNQDPMSPLEDKDFIAQIAQFSVLEEVKGVSEGLGKMSAMNYVGKYVTAKWQDMILEGRVEAASLSGREAVLHIGDLVIPVSDVIGVIYEG